MAGNYPDVPGNFMNLDVDGSVGFLINSSNVITPFTLSNVVDVNDGTGSSNGSGSERWGVIFPELRDLAGYYVCSSMSGNPGSDYPLILATSIDTTNGLDGTWTTRQANWVTSLLPTIPSYRTSIQTLAIPGIKAIRFTTGGIYGGTMYTIHLYGSIATGQSPDRLRFWDATLDQEVGPAFFDWGDMPRSGLAQKTFRIKNFSSSVTANAITVATTALTDASPTVVSQLTLSNGGAFAATTTAGTLAPGAISGVLTVRYSPLSNAALGLWQQRLRATATSWT